MEWYLKFGLDDLAHPAKSGSDKWCAKEREDSVLRHIGILIQWHPSFLRYINGRYETLESYSDYVNSRIMIAISQHRGY